MRCWVGYVFLKDSDQIESLTPVPCTTSSILVDSVLTATRLHFLFRQISIPLPSYVPKSDLTIAVGLKDMEEFALLHDLLNMRIVGDTFYLRAGTVTSRQSNPEKDKSLNFYKNKF